MKFCVVLAFLVMPWVCLSATYYVATNGNNAADGSLATPWSNIWYAANSVSAGDTVIIEAGEYNEFVTNTVSGSAGSPITFSGQRGPSGEWLTILDPSTPFTNGWVTAAEIGTGVWKQTNMPFTARVLTINNKRVYSTYTLDTLDNTPPYDSAPTTGAAYMLLATDATLNISGNPVTWWDSIGAFYCSTGSVCYLRLRDGSDPNGLNIRCAPNAVAAAHSSDLASPAIKNMAQSYIIWSNLLIRNAIAGFYLSGANVHHITIVSNSISGGGSRIVLALSASQSEIVGNAVTADLYGFSSPGAWGNQTSEFYLSRENLYIVSKYLLTENADTFDDGIVLANCGNSNTVAWNHVFKAAGENILIYADGATYHMTNTLVYSNLVENSSDVGILDSTGNVDTHIFNNEVHDCNINFRCHHMDYTDTYRTVYVYRNTFWLTNGAGEHIYFHYANDTPDTYFPTFWFYHNSFSGGPYWLAVSSYVTGSGGITNCHFLNNISSGCKYLDGQSFGGANYGFWTNAAMVGAFDYNLVTAPWPTYPTTNLTAWFAANNIRQDATVWTTNAIPDFKLPSGSAAINAALDLTVPFTDQGKSYPALPYGTEIKVGPAWDIGALEGGTVANAVTLRVGTLRGP